MNWIRTSEQKPDTNREVLIAFPLRDIAIARFKEDGWDLDGVVWEIDDHTIMWWRELPLHPNKITDESAT